MEQILRAVDVESSSRWRWQLCDENGRTVATHQVSLDDTTAEYEAFEDLYEYVRHNRLPHDPVGSETEIVERIGRWMGSQVFGDLRLTGTVRVVLPVEAEFLLSRPLELAHVDGGPLARNSVTLVYELAGARPVVAKELVGDRFRLLALFSLPTNASALALRAERSGLTRTVRHIASRSGKAIELRILQYGVTRERLRETVEESQGWDMLHISGHGDRGQLVLEKSDGSPDVVPTHDLIELLGPTRDRLKFAVLSACNSGAETAATTLRALHLEDAADSLEAQVADASRVPVGVARGLVDQLGVGVLAMRYPVADPFAIALADELYPRLLGDGQPMDKAVGLSVPSAAGTTPTVDRPALSLGTPFLLVPSSALLQVSAPPGRVDPDPYAERIAGFPPEPQRFLGRTQELIRASAAIAPDSGHTAVLFMGMAGAGKTACALELAHQHRGRFDTLAWWQAPSHPDRFARSLNGFALMLDSRLGGKLDTAMLDAVHSGDALRAFLPRLSTALRNENVLLVLDNLETLLSDAGTWRDPRWGPLMGCLIGHGGRSRVVMTSRVKPADLDTAEVLSIATHALSLGESVLLAQELPNLSRLLAADPAITDSRPNGDRELVRHVLEVVQGHPKLLELADAAAVDRDSLAERVAAAAAAGRDAPVAAFFASGMSSLLGSQFVAILGAWTAAILDSLPSPSRLLMELLAGLEDDDRYSWLLDQVWPTFWATAYPGTEPVSVSDAAAALRAAALIDVGDATVPEVGSLTKWLIHPGVAAAVRAVTAPQVHASIDDVTGSLLFNLCQAAVAEEQLGHNPGSRVIIATGLAAVPYLIRLRRWADACTMLDFAVYWDSSSAVRQLVLGYLLQLRNRDLDPRDQLMVDAEYSIGLARIDPSAALPLLRTVIAEAGATGQHGLASGAITTLVNLLRTNGDLTEALNTVDMRADWDRDFDVGPWTRAAHEVERLAILAEMNRNEEVRERGIALIEQLDNADPTAGAGEQVIPWSVREHLLGIVSQAALQLGDWPLAADLIKKNLNSKRVRQASEHEMMRAYFEAHLPLLHLKEYDEAVKVLIACQDSAISSGDFEMVGVVYGTRADIANELGQTAEAMRLTENALRYNYQSRVLHNQITSHVRLADFLSRDGRHQEAVGHRLAAAVLCRASGRTERYANTIQQIAEYLRTEGRRGLPADIDELADEVENSGVRLCDVLAELAPGPRAAANLFTDIVDEAEARSRAAREEVWPTSTFQSGHTRIEVKTGPTFSAEEGRWQVICLIANTGHHPFEVKGVHIESFESTIRSTWYAELRPGAEPPPTVIEGDTRTRFHIDGESLVKAIWNIGDCDCVVMTTSGEKLVHELRGQTGELFKLLCLTDSVRVAYGSVEKVTFPWTGPPEKLLQILETQETQWKLDFMVSKGFVRKITGPDGEDRYVMSDKGIEFLRQGD